MPGSWDLPPFDWPSATEFHHEAPLTLPRSLRVVAIGGGTGLSTLLRGFKRHVATPSAGGQPAASCRDLPCVIADLAAVVTVTDDGGSSGRLREDFKMLPPGDVRNCMVALSEDEHLLSKLFQYRFETGDLQGHSFGNLFVAALSNITGDFAQAVQMSSQILATRGHIYPATNVNVTLSARMDDGSVVDGETNITASHQRIVELMLDPPNADPCRIRLRPSPTPTSSRSAPARSTPRSSPICLCAPSRRRSPPAPPSASTSAT